MMVREEVKEEPEIVPNLSMLKGQARILMGKITDFDTQIDKLTASRTALKKELRAIHGRIVTIDLKGE